VNENTSCDYYVPDKKWKSLADVPPWTPGVTWAQWFHRLPKSALICPKLLKVWNEQQAAKKDEKKK